MLGWPCPAGGRLQACGGSRARTRLPISKLLGSMKSSPVTDQTHLPVQPLALGDGHGSFLTACQCSVLNHRGHVGIRQEDPRGRSPTSGARSLGPAAAGPLRRDDGAACGASWVERKGTDPASFAQMFCEGGLFLFYLLLPPNNSRTQISLHLVPRGAKAETLLSPPEEAETEAEMVTSSPSLSDP